MRKLFVANFPWDTHEPELKAHFEECGPITDVQIRRDRNGMPGIAFISFVNESDARTALVKMQGSNLGDRYLNVAVAARQDD